MKTRADTCPLFAFSFVPRVLGGLRAAELSMICTLFSILLVALATCSLRAQSEPSSSRRDAVRPNGKVAEIPIWWSRLARYLPASLGMNRRVQPPARGNSVLLSGDWLGGRYPPTYRQKHLLAATDGPMSNDQLAKASGRILHFPVL